MAIWECYNRTTNTIEEMLYFKNEDVRYIVGQLLPIEDKECAEENGEWYDDYLENTTYFTYYRENGDEIYIREDRDV